jgi:hypothetical protein
MQRDISTAVTTGCVECKEGLRNNYIKDREADAVNTLNECRSFTKISIKLSIVSNGTVILDRGGLNKP